MREQPSIRCALSKRIVVIVTVLIFFARKQFHTYSHAVVFDREQERTDCCQDLINAFGEICSFNVSLKPGHRLDDAVKVSGINL